MDAVLLVIHLIIAFGIIVLVLIQPAETGGFLGSGGSMSNMMAPRRKGDVLSRTTGILAGLFFATSLLLAVVANHRPHETKSILDASDDAAATEAVISDQAPENAATSPAADAPDLKSTSKPEAEKADKADAPKTDEEPKAPIAH